MVEDLIRRAQRRFVFNEALGQLAFAGAFPLAGLALILILGTRFLEWWTLGLFAAAGIAAGGIRLYRATPDVYTTAVRVDRNAQLHDVLSTAVYFTTHDAPYSNFQSVQREQAETASRAVDLDAAVPFTAPRSLYAVAALALLASALVGVRFFGTHGLDLRAPLTEVLFEDQAAKLIGRKLPGGDRGAQERLKTAESLLAKLGLQGNPDGRQPDELDKAIDQALENPGRAGEKNQKGQTAGNPEEGKNGQADAQPGGDPLDGKPGENGEKDDQGKAGAGKDAGDKGTPKDGQGSDSSSLMSKLKDAVQNMFSKAGDKNGSQGNKGQQPGQNPKADQKPGEKGAPGAKGQPQDQDNDQADSQDADPNSDSPDSQQPGKPGAKNQQSVAQAGSGAGSQDGDKSTKLAEQLKAMGKISEIIGKRADTVSGETSIEVQSGNQQLRTNYTKSNATHGEADSDVSRDEIPVALQPYVKEYFEQVRKAAASPKAKPATP